MSASYIPKNVYAICTFQTDAEPRKLIPTRATITVSIAFSYINNQIFGSKIYNQSNPINYFLPLHNIWLFNYCNEKYHAKNKYCKSIQIGIL
jgi:hypothetical protein